MYVSVTTIALETSRISEFVGFYERLLPLLRDVKGWQQLYLLVNDETSEGKVLALWENEADAYAFESGGHFRGIISQLQSVVGGPTDRKVMQVVFQSGPLG